MKKKENKFVKKLVVCSVIIFAVMVFVEVFIMNFTSLNLITGKYKTYQLDFDSSRVVNAYFEDGGGLSVKEGYSSIEFENIDMPVGAITIDADLNEQCDDVTVYISYTDETTAFYRRIIKYDLESNNFFENTIVCNFSGNVEKILFEAVLGGGEEIKINSITLNQPRNSTEMLAIIFMTFAAVAGAALLIFVFAGMNSSSETFEKRRKLCMNAAAAVTACVMIFTACLSVIYTAKGRSDRYASFTSTQGNQITQEIVDAFENGQVSLLEEPSEELLALDNPYDWYERSENDVSYLWDHCLYNGKYYSYYGIGPVIALFLPYHLITGFYFPSVWATLLFSLIGIIFLTKLYMTTIEKWFKKLPVGTTIMGLITVQIASGIFFSAARPLFYEIAISSGFACVTAGAALMLDSNILGDGKISYVKLCLSSCLLGYAVLCRPTLAVYCAAALFFIAFGLKKALGEKTGKEKTKGFFKYAAVSLTPFMVIALGQMIYNYLRFDNPLDFGIQYSLTINDFTHSEFHWKFVLINLYAYLLNMPRFTPSEFPFLESTFEYFGLNGYMFVDDVSRNLISVGILFRALPMLSYLFAVPAFKRTEKNKRPAAALLIGISCVLMPLIIIFSSWESGYAVRYNADFSWQMIMGALVIAFTLYNSCKSESTRKLLNIIFAVSTLLCIYVNVAQIFSFVGISLSF